MVIVCDSCGRENEDEFKFCLGCGSELSAPEPEPEEEPSGMIDCPHCASRVPSGFKFCGQCGGTLQEASEQAAPEPSSEPDPQQARAAEPQRGTGQQDRFDTSGGQPATGSDSSPGERLGELTVIRPDGSEGAVIPLTDQGVVLGRDSDFAVLADDPFLSPRHAEIQYTDGGFELHDLDSVNGVFWRLRDDVELRHGDMLRVGQELIQYQEFSQVEPVDDIDASTAVVAQGSPDPGIWGRLSLIGGPELETKAFALSGDGATIGREMGTVLFRDDGFVSGKHAKIYREGDTAYFRDLGSSNGSYIRIRQKRSVGHGDLVLIGQQLLRMTLE